MSEAAGSSRRRIALVLGTSSGGVGRHVLAVVHEAVRRGADVVVAGPSATDATFAFSTAGARFVPVEIADGPEPVADARALVDLRRAVRDRQLVHAHGLRAGFLAGVARPRGRPLVVTWHNAVLASGPLRRAYAVLEAITARRADVTLCVSGDLVERVRRLGGCDVRLAPVGGVRPERSDADVTEVRGSLGAPPGTPLVLAIGRLSTQKGFDVLIRAAAQVRHTPPPLFAIAGDGPLRDSLTALIAETGAPVRLLGWRTDGGDLLAAADLVVMSSRWEGSPLSAHETLLAGRPLVATAVGGLPDLLGRGAARLVPPEDVEALATAISALLSDSAARQDLAAAGAARAHAWPDGPAAARAVVDVHDELLGERR